MTDINVRALAELARLEVADEELAGLQKEIPAILHFVETIQNVSVGEKLAAEGSHNIMREDEHPHESGIHTEALMSAAPAREGDKISVKQVISRKT